MTVPGTKPGRGYLFYTGIAFAITMAIVVLIIGIRLGTIQGTKLLYRFMDLQPARVPVTSLSEDDVSSLKDRIAQFAESLSHDNAAAPLVISADEVNALIVATPELVTVRGQLHFDFQGTNVLAQFSVPAEDLGLNPLKEDGLYLTATGTFTVALTNGVLNVNARSLSAKNEPLPETFMNRISPQNFAFKLNHDERAKAALGRLDDVRVEEGKLLIVPKK